MTIQSVVVLGTGDVARVIVQALINASFNITVVSRSASSSSALGFPSSVSIRVVDYQSMASLAAAFKGQDAIVEAFNPAAADHQQNVVDAAIEVGVQHLITPDFSSDTFNEHTEELIIFEPKIKAQKYLDMRAQEGKIAWTAIIVGAFYDWGIRKGAFWIDGSQCSVTVFGSGDQKTSISSIDSVGAATVTVLKSPEKFRNRPAYFADWSVSTNELIEILRSLRPDIEWNVSKVPVAMLFAEAKRMWNEDTAKGVKERLSTKAYQYLGTYGVFEEQNRYGGDFNEKVEKGWGKDVNELREGLHNLLKESDI